MDSISADFSEEQDGEDVERRKRRRKATKRKREGKSQEEEGSLSCDIKLDESLDRTLEDGAKQHNLTVVNVRNILHVSVGSGLQARLLGGDGDSWIPDSWSAPTS